MDKPVEVSGSASRKDIQERIRKDQIKDRLLRMFQYHPPQTAWREEAHAMINAAALEFATTFAMQCPDLTDIELAQVTTAIQQARMLANQIITYKEIL